MQASTSGEFPLEGLEVEAREDGPGLVPLFPPRIQALCTHSRLCLENDYLEKNRDVEKTGELKGQDERFLLSRSTKYAASLSSSVN